jgi:hypothetical protein
MLKKLVVLLICCAAPSSAQSATDQNSLHGVWSGKIGNLPINACFDLDQDSNHFGSYYYLSQLKPIPLEMKDNGTTWSEVDDKNSSHWNIRSAQGDNISGTWSGGAKQLPLQLTRIKATTKNADGDDQPCGSNAFFAPRLKPFKITQSPNKLDGIAYTSIALDAGEQFVVDLETFKLNGNSPSISAINKNLLSILPMKGKAAPYIECLQNTLASSGRDGSYAVSITPLILTKSWLVTSSGDGSYCGGAHPVNSSSEDVYSLRNGKEIDLRDWLVAGTVDQEGKLSDALNQLVLRKFVEDPDTDEVCADSAKNAFGWTLSLAKKGVSFTPSLSYAETACMNPTILSVSEVAPFLNTDGKKQLTNFQSELPK